MTEKRDVRASDRAGNAGKASKAEEEKRYQAAKAQLIAGQAAYADAYAAALPELLAAQQELAGALARSKDGYQPKEGKLASVTTANARLEKAMKPLLAAEAKLVDQYKKLGTLAANHDPNAFSSLLRDKALFAVFAESL